MLQVADCRRNKRGAAHEQHVTFDNITQRRGDNQLGASRIGRIYMYISVYMHICMYIHMYPPDIGGIRISRWSRHLHPRLSFCCQSLAKGKCGYCLPHTQAQIQIQMQIQIQIQMQSHRIIAYSASGSSGRLAFFCPLHALSFLCGAADRRGYTERNNCILLVLGILRIRNCNSNYHLDTTRSSIYLLRISYLLSEKNDF